MTEQPVTEDGVRDDRAEAAALRAIERKVLWLATAMIDHAAGPERRDPDGVKVGGHQASCASMVTIMTSLWFAQLRAHDRVSVKPHASPVLHAINYLLGQLDAGQLESLRAFGGLQSYPSRTKDPDSVDYSTGSVGIGATAPVWGAIARRYIGERGSARGPVGRQYSLVGDAELDEGAVWEAILDPMVGSLGEIVWIVDFNRQSLDRVVPDISGTRLQAMFAAAGWQVIVVKYGRFLEEVFARPGGDALRTRIDEMTNPEYQRLLRHGPAELRERLPRGPGAERIRGLLDGLDDREVRDLITGLGGHDVDALLDAYSRIDDSRPTVIFAYTVKGHGLPNAGHPQNHSHLLRSDEMRRLAIELGEDIEDRWRGFEEGSPARTLCAATAKRLERDRTRAAEPPRVPVDIGRVIGGRSSTQQAIGRLLLDLRRETPEVARRVVTVAPDVASSTNLGGWLNQVGVWSPRAHPDWFEDDGETILHWREGAAGQHIELGIAEVNLVGLLGELGATWSRWGEPLLPIGTIYDPFVTRALEPWSFGVYAGGQSILVGTPSGVALAPEGGAHQSIITPSIGLEQPGVVAYEPAFAQDVEWCMLSALGRLGRAGGTSSYFRLSSRPIDQKRAEVPLDPAARERRRRQSIAGGYALRRASQAVVTLVGMGAVMPEILDAADRLAQAGVGADVVCVTSADLLYREFRRRPLGDARDGVLDSLFLPHRRLPVVTVVDGHPHTLEFVPALVGAPSRALGVTEFGQSGTLGDNFRHAGIDVDSIVREAKDLLGAP